jgi:predicted Zn-dependent protease
MAATICAAARAAGLNASGSVNATTSEVAVSNSLGIWSYTPLTAGRVVALAHGEGGSGHAEAHDLEIAAIDAEALAGAAVHKALAGRGAEAIEPGQYTVVLEPAAVADLVQFISLLGFGARAVREGTSFLTGKLGQAVLGPSITLRDDGHDPAGLPRPFDTEGVARRPLTLVRAGVAEEIAYDSYYAHLEGKRSTGHAITGRFSAGPVPINVFMEPGEATREELIAGVERGILVTRFHYTRVVHPHSVTVTGMTRDGTFLIERGAVARPVKNLRFTQSYVRALNQVEAIGREAELHGDFFVPRVPALRIADFTFTGSTV